MSSRPGAGSGWLYLLWRWRRLLGQDRIRLSADEVRRLEPDLPRPDSSRERITDLDECLREPRARTAWR